MAEEDENFVGTRHITKFLEKVIIPSKNCFYESSVIVPSDSDGKKDKVGTIEAVADAILKSEALVF